MRIGIDCRMYSTRFTGIGRYVYELTHNLAELDQQNQYVLFFNEPEFTSYQPANNRQGPRLGGGITKVKVNAPHYSFHEQTTFLKALNAQNLDLMHFTHFNAPILYNKPSIVTIHDLTLSFFPGKKMASPLHRLAYQKTIKTAVRKAAKVIAVSLNTKKDIQQILQTDPRKIKVIYEAVNPAFRPIKDETYKIKIKEKLGIYKPFLLYTGVWRTHKNLPNLIKAFHILRTEYGYDGQLVITGRHDPVYAPHIFQMPQTIALGDNIIFPGMVDELELITLYNAAEAYVFPSLYEGFGLPPLEAMQCGTPVAASNASCIPEVCGPDNALYFDPQNPQDMAEKIYRLVSEPTLRAALIARGLQHVKTFSWQKMARETLQVYNEAAGPDLSLSPATHKI